MTSDLDNFYLSKEEPNRSCLLAMRDILLAQDEKVNETRKYGMPCFCYGKKMFAYLWVDKKTHEPYILMVEGNRLDHPALEAGTRARMKILRVDPNADLPLEAIEEVLGMALDLYRNGVIKA